jgi:ABC-type polysaccharide/polyol phosphate transport system ATPase subunit
MDDVAIRVDSISKTFKLPHEKNTSIKGVFVNFWRRNRRFEEQKVLQNVSFEVKKGEFFGIVGRNGSGKSTLLKLLSGIYTPTKGSIQINGSLTPFIELGVGFNPELTGRENVFLNGALLGFTRTEVAAMYDDIVNFAELRRFMDQKLKNYSSGMQVRLAFSIAIQAKNDILILDEVLAVGDEAFQKKCIDVFENYRSQKRTVILVTHDMATVKRFCSRAMLINDGHIVSSGDPAKIAHNYTQINDQSIDMDMLEKELAKSHKRTTKVNLTNGESVKYGERLALQVDWSGLKKPVKNIGVAIYGNTGEYIFGTNTIVDKVKLPVSKSMTYNVDADIGPGNYHFKIGMFGDTDREVLEFIYDGPEFMVKPNGKLGWEGLTALAHSWEEK